MNIGGVGFSGFDSEAVYILRTGNSGAISISGSAVILRPSPGGRIRLPLRGCGRVRLRGFGFRPDRKVARFGKHGPQVGRPGPVVRKTTRDLAAWAVSPLGLGLWVVMMAQRPRMMEQLHSIFLGPALVGLLLFGLGLCFSQKHIASWGRSRHESRHHLTWGLVSATGFGVRRPFWFRPAPFRRTRAGG